MPVKPLKTIIHRPKDLAEFIHKRLEHNTIDIHPIELKVLEDLFDGLFYASLHSEEGELIRVTVTLFEEANPQLKTRKFEAGDKWRYVPFAAPIPFTVNNLVKLSKAADPWSSSLAVYYDHSNELFIYGMIDQAIHSLSYINFESDHKPDQPGYFNATINGIGNISVTTEYDLIATLKQDCLICEYLNVFQSGPVRDHIRRLARVLTRNMYKPLKESYPEIDPTEWEGAQTIIVRNTLARILNQIKKYNHGGALLFSNETDNLDIKYNLEYDRLASAMANIINVKIGIDQLADTDLERSLTLEEHIESSRLTRRKKFAENELKGAIRFVASQSCVDGLVLLNYSMVVKGFGVVINSLEQPRYIYKSSRATPNAKNLDRMETEKFGTRHRSMFAYCDAYPGSLGFVISQDGDIRAVTKIGEQLVMWENIQTQKTLRSAFFKRDMHQL